MVVEATASAALPAATASAASGCQKTTRHGRSPSYFDLKKSERTKTSSSLV